MLPTSESRLDSPYTQSTDLNEQPKVQSMCSILPTGINMSQRPSVKT